jgi:hypothetical protein
MIAVNNIENKNRHISCIITSNRLETGIEPTSKTAPDSRLKHSIGNQPWLMMMKRTYFFIPNGSCATFSLK